MVIPPKKTKKGACNVDLEVLSKFKKNNILNPINIIQIRCKQEALNQEKP